MNELTDPAGLEPDDSEAVRGETQVPEHLREALSGLEGRDYWLKLEELSGSPEVLDYLRTEFSSQAGRFEDGVGRRDFLRLMGASLAAGGLGACTRQPDERIVPYATNPEATIPGRPRHFATTMSTGAGALGLLVESHEGRPTKIEGNPDHPSSLGATDAFAQAAILGLYDPDRSHTVKRAGRISTWSEFVEALRGELESPTIRDGAGLRILTSRVLSPTLDAQLAALTERYPEARIHRWYPVHRDNERGGAELAFGRDLTTRYHFDRADLIIAFDADCLGAGPDGVRNARDFAQKRKARAKSTSINRIFAVESSISLLGAMADNRLAVKPTEVELLARALAHELGIGDDVVISEEQRAFVHSMAEELRAHMSGSRKSLVVAGEFQSPAVHALVHVINHALGNLGRTVEVSEPAEPSPGETASSLRTLVEDMRAGEVATLLIVGGNPVYDGPSELEFGEAIKGVPFRAHLSLYDDETSELCHWHVPQTHFLETWSDARAHDGTASIVQPLIAPLYDGRSEHEFLAIITGEAAPKSYDIVRAFWRAERGFEEADEEGFDRFWLTALHDGVIAGSAFPALDIAPRLPLDVGIAPQPQEGFEIAFRPDASTYDGRFANNGWLQETPRPLTRLTWDNAALLSPASARSLGVSSGDMIELVAGDRTMEIAVWETPGHPDEVVTLHLGYGRRQGGRLGREVGFDAYFLRSSYTPWTVSGVRASKVRGQHLLASVQDHGHMEGRDIVRVATFDRFKTGQAFEEQGGHSPEELSMYKDHAYEGYSWGMVIDLNACIGCNACMVACQSENNVPIVGKAEVARGREMHWIRIDRYYEESESGAQVLHQPVPCMHCENAPCEVVCPVGATVHGSEGLNEMVYNRCIGTRYCSNNCPYKVRRFNFFHYADDETESLKLGRNPDVTVRSRGVMEKCTYCVQRINQARIESKKEDRMIADGEVRTACQSVCPTEAITFGNINDATSAVSKLRREPHHYGLLAELDTRPRTTYLAKLTNPKPEGDGG